MRSKAVFIVSLALAVLLLPSIPVPVPLARAQSVTASSHSFLLASKGIAPYADGKMTIGDYWDQVRMQEVEYDGGILRVGAKHDDQNLYLLIQCIDTDSNDCPEDIYFEDDGSAPNRVLEGNHEDWKFYGDSGMHSLGYYDGHWDKQWTTNGEMFSNKNGNRVELTEANTVTQEWWLPLDSKDTGDIQVTGPEDLGFMVGSYGGWPNMSADPEDAATWGTLHIDYWPDLPPVAEILAPGEKDTVRSDLSVKINARDPDPKKALSSVQVSVNNGPWQDATKSDPRWVRFIDTTTYAEGKNLSIRARAFDGKLYSATDTVNVTVRNNGTDGPPVVKQSIPSKSFPQDQVLKNALSLSWYFEDPDTGQALSYTAVGATHVHLAVHKDSTVDLSGDTGWYGTECPLIRATDGTYWAEADMYVTVTKVNHPPTIEFDGDLRTVDVKETFYLSVDSYDQDRDLLQYRMVSGPKGASVNATTGMVRWKPTLEQEGGANITVEVSDGAAQATITIPVFVEDIFAKYSIFDFISRGSVNNCPDTWYGHSNILDTKGFFGALLDMNTNHLLHVTLSTEYEADFYLLNESNNLRYFFAETASEFDSIPNGTKEFAKSIDYTFMPTTKGYYTIIVDNSRVGKALPVPINSLTYSVSCEVYSPPKPTPPKEPNQFQAQNLLIIVGVIAVIIVVSLVLWVGLSKLSKGQKPPAETFPPPPPAFYSDPQSQPGPPGPSYYSQHLALQTEPPPGGQAQWYGPGQPPPPSAPGQDELIGP